VLLAVVFFGHYVAGLSGHEPAILFAVGLLLLGVELVFFPGIVAPALMGVACMMISLLWAMADIWPNQPISFSGDIFVAPAMNLGLALLIAVGLAILLMRFLPKSWFWDRLVLATAIDANSQMPDASTQQARHALIGAEGVAVTDMFPSGEVEINGRRYQARLVLGHITAGTAVIVKSGSDFSLIVERKSP
jgi:membrane-bound serine protease (ClpP class)